MTDMIAILSIAFAILGAAFLLLAGIGIVRLPDVYCRASAATKAATLGIGCVLIAALLHFEIMAVTTRVIATIAFVMLTAPVSAHVICRAAYYSGTPLCSSTTHDELKAVCARSQHLPRQGTGDKA